MCYNVNFQIVQNIGDLNQIVTENQKDVQFTSNGALFQKPSVVSLTFYKDGFRLGDGGFRSYGEDLSKTFTKGSNFLLVPIVLLPVLLKALGKRPLIPIL